MIISPIYQTTQYPFNLITSQIHIHHFQNSRYQVSVMFLYRTTGAIYITEREK